MLFNCNPITLKTMKTNRWRAFFDGHQIRFALCVENAPNSFQTKSEALLWFIRQTELKIIESEQKLKNLNETRNAALSLCPNRKAPSLNCKRASLLT